MGTGMRLNRETGIEALRCVLMFLIVFGHCCLFSTGSDPRISKILSVPVVFATDAFILISGWFGVRFSVMKIVRFLGVGVFACMVVTISGLVLGVERPFKYSLGWFGNAYLALMLLSPLINAGLEALKEKDLLVRGWTLYAVAMLLSWLPIRFLGIDFVPTGWSGLSFNTMCFVYVTGRVMREMSWIAHVRTRTVALWFAGLMVLNLMWSGMAGSAQSLAMKGLFVGSKDYDSPIVLGLAICFFLLFKRLEIRGWAAKVIGWCTPSMFAVYLLSEGCNGRVSRALYNRYAYFDFGGGVAGTVLQIVVASIVVFFVCLALDCARRTILWSIRIIRK